MKSFVYCEWIDDDRLLRALPSARFVARVTLDDYRLAFVSFKEDGNDTILKGGCYLEPAPGQQAAGLLYEFDDTALNEAERLSRVEQGRYCGKSFTVRDSEGRAHEAVAYVIKNPVGSASPSTEYKNNMLNGARKHGFSSEYISYISAL